MTLKIRRAATRVENKVVVGPPKTDAGVRDVTVPPHVATQLREHMTNHTGKGPEAFVFTTTRGQRLSTTAFTKAVKAGFADVGKAGHESPRSSPRGSNVGSPGRCDHQRTHEPHWAHNAAMAMRYQIAAQERDAAIADKLSELAGFRPTPKTLPAKAVPNSSSSRLFCHIFPKLDGPRIRRTSGRKAIATEIFAHPLVDPGCGVRVPRPPWWVGKLYRRRIGICAGGR